MKFHTALAGLFLIVAPSQIIAGEPEPQPAQQPAAKSSKDPNRIICRTDDEIGSRIHKKRICLTAAQWRDVSHESGFATERKEALVAKPGGG